MFLNRIYLTIFCLFILSFLSFSQNADVIKQEQYRTSMFTDIITGEIERLVPSSTLKKKEKINNKSQNQNTNLLQDSLSNSSQDFDEVDQYTILMQRITQQILPPKYPKTQILAYGGLTNKGVRVSFPAPTLVADYKIPTKIKWVNNIFGPHFLPYDQNFPFNSSKAFTDQIPVVPHVHGVATHNSFDGQPNAYWTALGTHGKRYDTQEKCEQNEAIYTYPNQQDPGIFWYHDHTMGMTRLNVYAGLAGLYLIQKSQARYGKSIQQQNLQKIYGFSANETITKTLVITDKTFHKNGSLYYSNQTTNKHFSSWIPQFFGNTFVVNGKVWPKMILKPGKHRFVILNACQARYLNFFFLQTSNKKRLPFDLIRTQGDYLNNPIRMSEYLASLSARIQIVLDLSTLKNNDAVLMKNDAPAPYPDGDPLNLVDQFTGTILKIVIQGVAAEDSGSKSKNKESNLISTSRLKLLNNIFRKRNKSQQRRVLQKIEDIKEKQIKDQIKIQNQEQNMKISKKRVRKSYYPLLQKQIPFQVLTNLSIKFPQSNYPAFPQGKPIYTTILQVMDDQGIQSSGMYIDGVSFQTSEKCDPSSTYKSGQTYDFYMINLTPDSHPMHFHLINFQKIKEIPFDAQAYQQAWFQQNGGQPGRGGYQKMPIMIDPSPFFTGPAKLSKEYQKSFRDIIDLHPSYVTVIRAKFAHNNGQNFSFPIKNSSYVYHCHMLQHQDNDMMKYFCLQ